MKTPWNGTETASSPPGASTRRASDMKRWVSADVLEHVHAHDGVERRIGKRQPAIGRRDGELELRMVRARPLDSDSRHVDARHLCTCSGELRR